MIGPAVQAGILESGVEPINPVSGRENPLVGKEEKLKHFYNEDFIHLLFSHATDL